MVARLPTTIECVPAVAVVSALAVRMLESEEVAAREASAPLGSASAMAVAAKLVRLFLSPVSRPAWVDRSVCWFCQFVNEAVCEVRIAVTTDFILMPFPFSRDAELKLTPIIVPFCLYVRGRGLC